MGLKMLESRLCLLLLLGLTLSSCQGVPSWQWFKIQHIYNDTNPRCDDAMRAINGDTGNCKDFNTFLHTSFADVVQVCNNPPTTCKDGKSKNCHESTAQVLVTSCTLTRAGINYCKYNDEENMRFYRVKCKRTTPQDKTKYPLVPVHLDDTF
ncbi:ribonuclease 2B-like [Arvicanthis niloticus]|uniref:ribonuclease 2B-like n=1 Tax=Arvicanthis niloticus TaxID=61156 RepID=UPI0014866CDD|nr:ribonuclease 2B-like [Arvicanthis niloticus]